MNQPMQNPYPLNAQAELARERNHISADRSLLKFIDLGTFARLCAALDHREQLKRIQRNDWVYIHRHSPSQVVAYGAGVPGNGVTRFCLTAFVSWALLMPPAIAAETPSPRPSAPLLPRPYN
jgi:hypothetical protein